MTALSLLHDAQLREIDEAVKSNGHASSLSIPIPMDVDNPCGGSDYTLLRAAAVNSKEAFKRMLVKFYITGILGDEPYRDPIFLDDTWNSDDDEDSVAPSPLPDDSDEDRNTFDLLAPKRRRL